MSIINVFNNEKELFDVYPKKVYFQLKDIFSNYWNDFLIFAKSKNLCIRPVVIRDVNRMINCKSPSLGFSLYKCPSCGNEKLVPHTCKSRWKGLFLLNQNLLLQIIDI